MNLKYLGHSSFLIKSKDARLVTDPYKDSAGLKFPKVEADIVTVSHQHEDHNETAGIGGDPLLINYPGEFEKLGIRITGYERGENILYKIEVDGILILHGGSLEQVPTDDFIEELGDVDILLVPVGGEDETTRWVKKIEPSMVIPYGETAQIEDFLKKMGSEAVEPVDQLTLKKEDIVPELSVVVMKI